MEDFLKYRFTEIKRHFHMPKHFIKVFGKRRDISRVVTTFKVVVETFSVASTVSFAIKLLK